MLVPLIGVRPGAGWMEVVLQVEVALMGYRLKFAWLLLPPLCARCPSQLRRQLASLGGEASYRPLYGHRRR